MNELAPLSAFAGYGIELEYMIVDRASLSIKPIAEMLCSDAHSTGMQGSPIGCSNELVLHLIELKNQEPTADLPALRDAFQAQVRSLNQVLLSAQARLMPGAMHPWMVPQRETRLWPHQQAEIYQAYDRIFDCRRHGHANVQSMQINLPFASDAEFARLHDAIRLALPIIPALAASSPFAESRWSGFLDYRLETYRTHQQQVASTMGELIPERITSRAQYESDILAPMYRDIAAFDPEGILHHEWLNVRAAVARFERSAIEIRIADVQECPAADIAIAAAVIELTRYLYAMERDCGPAETRDLLAILRACIADAEQAVITDATYLRLLQFPGQCCTAAELWQHLLETLEQDQLTPWLPTLHFILRHGTLARRLLQRVGVAPQRSRLEETYGELCLCLHEGRMFQSQS